MKANQMKLKNEIEFEFDWMEQQRLGVPPSFHLSSLFASPHPSPREDKWEEERKANQSLLHFSQFASFLQQMEKWERVGLHGAARFFCGWLPCGCAAHNPPQNKLIQPHFTHLSARTAANQSNQSNKNKIILFFFVDDWLLDCSLGAAKKSKDNLIELPILKEQFKLNLSFYFSCSHQSVHLPQIQIKLTHCFVFVYNSWLAAYTVIIYF